MNKHLPATIIFLLLSFVSCLSQSQVDSTLINRRIEAFSLSLSSFPPHFKDSVEARAIEQHLLAFIDTMQTRKRENAFQDNEQYYLWMAQLYHFGYNLDVPGAMDKCIEFYEQALRLNPKSIKARMGLSAHYGQNWSPGDTSTFQNLYKGYHLLKEIYDEGSDTADPALYSNMLFYGMCFHSKAICYDALFKLIKYFPADTNINSYKGMVASFKDDCINMERRASTVIYENKCAQFRVQYSDNLDLYNEDPHQPETGVGFLMLETPLTMTNQNERIRNNISLIATPASKTSEGEIIQNFLRRGDTNLDSLRTTGNKNGRSFYFSSRASMPEKFKGILTVFADGDFFYQAIYMATESTFAKNLGYFLELEKSLSYL